MPRFTPSVKVGALLALVAALSACEPTPPQPKLGSAPVEGQTPNATPSKTDAVQGLQADAATVAQSDGGHPAVAGAPISEASPLNELKAYVGSYPSDQISFLEQGALADRLKPLLGKAYPALLANLRTASPLTEDQGRWFITGNRPHEGGSETAAVVVDAAQNAIRVWLQHEGTTQEFLDPPSAQISWPQDVQTMLSNQLPAKS